MPLAEGSYRLGPPEGHLLLRTYRTGLGSRIGHDLIIEVTDWGGTAQVDRDDPARSEVTVRINVDSLEVRKGTGGLKPLTDGDRAEIKKRVREKILKTGSHPEIAFAANRYSGTLTDLGVEGSLTIMGIRRPISFRASVLDQEEPAQVRGHAQVIQSEWGIKPYSAFFGALQLRDAVDIDFDAALIPI
jgi:polyisoprenoid-binding protein YceI